MIFTFYDIEYIIIYTALTALFFFSLKKKDNAMQICGGSPSVIDLNMSSAMKGMACVMILMGHWGQRRFVTEQPLGVSWAIQHFSATIALVWFMFFSGYGLSLKTMKDNENIIFIWLRRIKKVYLPLLFCCIICTIGYAFLPSVYSLDEFEQLWVSKDIYYLHHLSLDSLNNIWPHMLGWKDWYVLCIIIFYSLFYLSLLLERYTRFNQTTYLFILMCLYYVWAFYYFGRPEGHFFRYCWIFFVSHVIAKWKTYRNKWVPLLMSFMLCTTLLMESKIMLFGSFMAISLLLGGGNN